MKNNSHFRNKSEKLTYIGYGFLLFMRFFNVLCTKNLGKRWFYESSIYVCHPQFDRCFF